MEALLGEVRGHVHEPPSSVGQAVGQDGLQLLGHVARQGVAHLDGRPSSEARCFNTAGRFSPACRCPVKNNAIRCPSRIETMPEVNTPVRSAASPDRSRSASLVGRSGPAPSSSCRHCAGPGPGPPGGSSPRRPGRSRRHWAHDLPLRRRRQGDAQAPLQPFEAIERKSAPVLQQRDHAGRFGVILVRSHARRRLGREHLAAQVAAQLLQFVHRGPQGRLTLDPHKVTRFGSLVHRALFAVRAGIPRLERLVRHADLLGARHSLRPRSGRALWPSPGSLFLSPLPQSSPDLLSLPASSRILSITLRVVSVVAPKSSCLSRWTDTRFFSNSWVRKIVSVRPSTPKEREESIWA